MRRPPQNLAEAVRVALESGGQDGVLAVAIDEFLDAFYTEAPRRQAMIDDEPPATGVARTDAWVGAVAEHLARRWDLQIPRWSLAPWRVVADPWFVGMMGEGLSALYLAESPIAFRWRRIFTEAEPLRRARMPREATAAPRTGDAPTPATPAPAAPSPAGTPD